MSINLDQALQTYIAEARELLEEMESALLTLENEPDNSELIGAIFRAAHTIRAPPACLACNPSSASPTLSRICSIRCATSS